MLNDLEMIRGKWADFILYKTGVDLAKDRGRHVPCPMCGGTDRFRFDDLDGRGTWYCNQCGGNDGRGGAGDGVTLYMRLAHKSFKEAMEDITLYANGNAVTHSPPKDAVKSEWLRLPLQDGALLDRLAADKVSIVNGRTGNHISVHPEHVAVLRDENGKLVGAIVRWRNQQGAKIPMHVEQRTHRVTGEIEWVTCEYSGKRPFYRIDKLMPVKPTLVLLGEKKSDDVAAALPAYNVVSIVGGDKSVKYMDYEPLQRSGSRVYVCPDNDASGRDAARYIQGMLPGSAIVRLPGDKPEGWDFGDAVTSDGWDARKLESFILSAIEPVKPEDAQATEQGIRSYLDVPSMLPDDWAETSGRERKPLNTMENLSVMLKHYGIDVTYDVIQKSSIVRIPGVVLPGGKKDEDVVLSHLNSLSARNGFPKSDLSLYIRGLSDQRQVNPVKDWIDSKAWDGTDRLPALYATIKSPDDPRLWKSLVRRWLVCAVSCIYKEIPNATHGILLFQGPQGSGKTTWIRNLLPEALSMNYIMTGQHLDPTNRDSAFICLSRWIVELGEIGATISKNIDGLKAFITNSSDRLRLPYARGYSEYPRRTVFAGSVDKEYFLKEDENRRFWTVRVADMDYEHEDLDMQQVWAQVKTLMEKGERTYLTKEENHLLQIKNESVSEVDEIWNAILPAYDWDSTEKDDWRYLTTPEIFGEIFPGRVPTRSSATRIGTLLNKHKITSVHRRGGAFYLMPPKLDSFAKMEMSKSIGEESYEI